MNDLLLDSLDIQGFRAFDHLRIERLGRVNLIVGRNNVGKTSLLEALRVYAGIGNPDDLFELLASRDESGSSKLDQASDNGGGSAALRFVFYGRKNIDTGPLNCVIRPLDDPKRSLELTVMDIVHGLSADVYKLLEEYRGLVPLSKVDLVYLVRMGGEMRRLFFFGRMGGALHRDGNADSLSVVFVSAISLSRQEANLLWDRIVLTNLEDAVLDALRIIAPDIARLNLVSYHEGFNEGMDRIPLVRLKNLPDPIPLRSLGEGMNRLFGIALALVNAKDGFLLVDEIESGIHHSVQTDLWRLIFTMARRLNVQVFATTHSRDCIEAFQIAAAENADEDGMLIRLEREGESIVPTLFDSRRLAIATREQIEVR